METDVHTKEASRLRSVEVVERNTYQQHMLVCVVIHFYFNWFSIS